MTQPEKLIPSHRIAYGLYALRFFDSMAEMSSETLTRKPIAYFKFDPVGVALPLFIKPVSTLITIKPLNFYIMAIPDSRQRGR
jgi:hypothetical protein